MSAEHELLGIVQEAVAVAIQAERDRCISIAEKVGEYCSFGQTEFDAGIDYGYARAAEDIISAIRGEVA